MHDSLLASAFDIVNYVGCPHRTTLDLIDLETPLEKAERRALTVVRVYIQVQGT